MVDEPGNRLQNLYPVAALLITEALATSKRSQPSRELRLEFEWIQYSLQKHYFAEEFDIILRCASKG